MTSIIDGSMYTCPMCGGHKFLPEGDSIYWFWKPRNGRAPEQIAFVRTEGDGRWRVAKFDPRGPVTHNIEPAENILYEVKGFRLSKVAPKLLDYWSQRPAWRDGMRQAL